MPAVMAGTWDELRASIEAVCHVAPVIQIDVMDGVFVPPISFPYALTADEELTMQEIPTLPEQDTTLYEVHLMVANPACVVERFVRAGAKRVVFHCESFTTCEGAGAFVAELRAQSVEPVASLLLDTPLEAVTPLLDDGSINAVQVMSIAEIGYQGHAFDERAVERIRTLHERYPKARLSIDGGIKEDTLAMLARSGVTLFGVGSAIMHAADPAHTYTQLQHKLDAICTTSSDRG